MNRYATLFLLTLFILVGPCRMLAGAGSITLGLSTSVSYLAQSENAGAGSQARVAVTITNSGTDSARNLSLQARLLDSRQTLPVPGELPPGKSATLNFSLPVPSSLTGTWPLFLNLLYSHPDGVKVNTASVAFLRTSDGAASSPLTLTVSRKRSGTGQIVTAQVVASDPTISDVVLTCFAPPALSVDREQQSVHLQNGRGAATFRVAGTSGIDGKYQVHFLAETDLNGRHELVSTPLTIPVSVQSSPLDRLDQKTWQALGGVSLLLVLCAAFLPTLSRGRITVPDVTGQPGDRAAQVVDLAILIACTLFIIINLNPQSLLMQTTTTGGDTASHYYTLDYLKRVLLPAGRVSGWTMGNYGGFPLLQFYFPLPFLTMCLLGIVIPLQIAFKIVTLLGTLLMPIGAYLMLRLLRRPFPAPILGAIFTLPFLFHSANSMWGANILSTLAGEFSYSLSFSLSLILLGTLYYGARQERWVIGNALMVFLVGFSHGYTLLFVEAVSLFFLISHDRFIQRFLYLLKVYALGFFLLAFWLVPLLVFTRMTTSYHLTWVINSWKEIFPPQVLPFALCAVAGTLVILAWTRFRSRDNELTTACGYLWFGLLMAFFFYVAAPKLGVVDIRYVPYGQLLVAITSALCIGWLTRFIPSRIPLWTLPLLCMTGVFLWVGSAPGPAPAWAKWNYEGFEAKPEWPVYKKLNSLLQGGFSDPRVMYEHAEDHNVFGSSRAFESLPLFSGRATLEGLYMQASISAPFVFYLQSEVSAVKSAPFPQYTYTSMNFQRALPHLQLFNVGELILRSSGAKQAIQEVAGYKLRERVGDYEIWQVTANSGRYVEPLTFEPVLFGTKNWKTESYRWFIDEEQRAVHPVFDDREQAGKDRRFKSRATELSRLPRIPIDTGGCRVTESIGNDEIRITTNWINKPLLVKVSYHPNWRVEGADRIYPIAPSFMLIYPNQPNVRLYYGRGWPDRAGAILTLLGLAILVLNLPLFGVEKRSLWFLAAERCSIPPSLVPELHPRLSEPVRKRILLVALLLFFCGGGWLCYQIYTGDINRTYNRGVRLKDAKNFEASRADFRRVIASQPFSNLSQDSAYYIAICYYLEKKDEEAIAAFRKLIADYPKSLWVPEAWYHIGLCQFRLGRESEGGETMRKTIRDFPGTEWAGYAGQRLAEKNLKGAP